MSKIFVKPNYPNTIVRVPERGNVPLSQDGEHVDNNSYWQRRLRDGDVVEFTPTKPKTNKGDK